MRLAFVLALGLNALGCNDLVGAGQPQVVGTSERADGDGESSGSQAKPLCGNGVVDPGEQCDDGNDADGDGCFKCQISCGPFPELERVTPPTCYRFTAEKKTWRVAEEACAAWGGKLAALTTLDEFAFVQEHVHADTWVGVERQSGAASFQWVTNEPWQLQSYLASPPMDDSDACGLIGGDDLAFRWESCAVAASSVCEKALPPP